ncbi:hypothetical protein Tco_1184574 [Tanacetum coccineum]
MNSSLEKLWYLADEDDEEETYVFDMNEFSAIQIHNYLSSSSEGTRESLYSTLDEKYNAITCDFSPELEFLLASESHNVVLVCSLDTFEEEYKDDLFTYDVEFLEPSYMSCVEQPYDDLENGNLDIYEPRQCYDEYERMFVEAIILIDNRLLKLIDITSEQWLDLKFEDHKKVDKEIVEGVVATWLIRSYRKQFEEYIEIKRRLEVNGLNTDVECDPTNKRGDDEEVLTYDEFYDLEKENLREGNEIAEIFRIETDICDFETPLCKEFKEFNYVIQIDVDVLTKDLPGFKTYEEYKNAWIYEWNNKVSWINEKS